MFPVWIQTKCTDKKLNSSDGTAMFSGNNTHMLRGIQERKERQGQETKNKNKNKNHLKHKLTF